MRNPIIAIITIWLVSSIAVESRGQDRIFRAVPIDEIQNRRLDASEHRLARIESSIASLAAAVDRLAAKPAAVVQQPPAVTHVGYQPAPVQREPAQQSTYYTTDELRQQILYHRPTLQSYAGDAYMAPGSDVYWHLVSPDHGFTWDQIRGLSRQEANVLHALAPNHKNVIFPRRSTQPQQQYQQPQPIQQPVYYASAPQPQRAVQYVMSNCAFGTCQPVRRLRR